ncbi:hypothetical protein Tco_0928861 [Tanacetum coccineum]
MGICRFAPDVTSKERMEDVYLGVKSVNHEAITSLLSSINHVSNGESTRGVGFCAKLTHKTSTNVTSKNDMLAILRCLQFDQTAIIEAQMIEEMIGRDLKVRRARQEARNTLCSANK